MDEITQLQNYVAAISAMMAQSVEQIMSPPTDLTGMEWVDEKAEQIFKRVVEADVLMGSLPAQFASEAEQMKLIEKLEAENKRAGEKLDDAKKEALLWRERISRVLYKLSPPHDASCSRHVTPPSSSSSCSSASSNSILSSSSIMSSSSSSLSNDVKPLG
eukprot:TRINITY_DN1794_c0_g1_i1.p1 TRINITY_DN1794_c0_g1~~TRINITY_DN1794_c0_g1_i1.p1  ORF type:complete len:160 (+),score=50.78 TRINITY_DN1794_c0_g1_i1:102-581(+)